MKFKDIETGEILEKISDWEIYNGEAFAYFKAKSGAMFSMCKTDVARV